MEAHSTAAQRDDEHRKALVLKGGVSRFLGRGGEDPYGSTFRVQEKDGDAIIEGVAAGAYFLSSLSMKLADRLYDDFRADAVLAVTNVPEFLSRMAKAAASKFMNRHAGAVSYRHPVVVFGRCSVPLPLPFFDKDLEYEYQKEYRLMFVCSEQTMPHIQASKDGRDYIDFNLGVLDDVTEVLYREGPC